MQLNVILTHTNLKNISYKESIATFLWAAHQR